MHRICHRPPLQGPSAFPPSGAGLRLPAFRAGACLACIQAFPLPFAPLVIIRGKGGSGLVGHARGIGFETLVIGAFQGLEIGLYLAYPLHRAEAPYISLWLYSLAKVYEFSGLYSHKGI